MHSGIPRGAGMLIDKEPIVPSILTLRLLIRPEAARNRLGESAETTLLQALPRSAALPAHPSTSRLSRHEPLAPGMLGGAELTH